MSRKRVQEAAKPKKRGTRPYSIRQVRLRMSWAVAEASELLSSHDPDVVLRAVSAMSTAAGVYARLTEASVLQDRIKALEQVAEKRSGS